MTMVEENALEEHELRLDAESIEIPEGGPERILTASRATTTQARRRRPHLTLPDLSWSRGRRIVVAAVVLLVVGGATLAPGRQPGSVTRHDSGVIEWEFSGQRIDLARRSGSDPRQVGNGPPTYRIR